MNKLSNLPPGVTDADVERAAGVDERIIRSSKPTLLRTPAAQSTRMFFVQWYDDEEWTRFWCMADELKDELTSIRCQDLDEDENACGHDGYIYVTEYEVPLFVGAKQTAEFMNSVWYEQRG